MNVSTPFHPRLLLCMLVVAALLAPTTHASAPPASTVTVDSTKPGCKRNPRRVALERQRTRSSADTAARGRGKKCRDIIRAYRGTTSQGKRIELKTRTSEFGTKLFSGKVALDFEAERMCTDYYGQVSTITQEYTPFFQKLKAPERTFNVFDPQYKNANQNLTMTGKVSTRMASGKATMAAEDNGQDKCAAASFTFSIPRVKNPGNQFP